MHSTFQSAQTASLEISGDIGPKSQQWIQLLTLGTMHTVDGRGPYKVLNPTKIIASSFRNISTDKLPIDYNHALDVLAPKGHSTPAAGWISKMEVRPDGIWGLAEWTPKAAKHVADKEYRFLSPTILYTQGDNEIRSILRASLTNNPNMTLKSLNAAEQASSMNHEQFMRDLRAALDLDDAADATAVLEAVKASKSATSANSADPSRFVPIETFQLTVAELNKMRSGISLQAAENVVEKAMQEGQIMPFMRDWAVSLCQANAAAFDDFLNGAGKPIAAFAKSLHAAPDWSKFHQRDMDGANGTGDNEVNRALGLSADDVKTYGEKSRK